MSSTITYEQLKTMMRERAGTDGLPSLASLPNTLSSLNEFLRLLELTEKAVINETLRDGFTACVAQMVKHMEEQRADPRHVKNRRSGMQHWYQLIRTLDHEHAVESGSLTPFQKRLRELDESLRVQSKSAFYRRCGLAMDTVRKWKRGVVPCYPSIPRITALEREAELPVGTLLALLPYNRFWERRQHPERDVGAPIAYRERLTKIQRDRLAIPDRIPLWLAQEEWTKELREEWRGLVEYKTGIEIRGTEPAMHAALGALRSAMAAEPKSVRKQWRLRPKADYPETHEPWVGEIGEFRVPSAIAAFGHVSSFLGWARRPVESGGKGIDVQTMTLGLVTDPDLLRGYIESQTVRAGGTNRGIACFLDEIKMLVHEQTGYLPKHPEIGKRAGVSDPIEWRNRCAAAKSWIAHTSGNIAHLIKPTRDPVDPIRFALDHEEPLKPFITGLKRYARQFPVTAVRRAAQARDTALLALTMSNPLRGANLRLLTYLPDNTGNFRKKRDGGWELFVPSEQFKNFRGAAKDDYCQNIDPSVWPFLEDYLENHRHVLAPFKRGLVFVASASPKGKQADGEEELWDKIGQRFRRITRIYVPGCPGVGPHAMRYIVGTSIIMGTNGNYIRAAKVLHDLPRTVERHYAKLLQEIANRSRDEVLGPILASIHSGDD